MSALRLMKLLTSGALALVLALLFPSQHMANAKPILDVVSTQTSKTLPKANLDFPHPREQHQVFFVQRTTNANTIVYVARFDDNGDLNPQNPIDVYWRRFAGTGKIKDLRWYERTFGFGVRTRPLPDSDGYRVAMNAVKDHPLELRQSAPFEAALWTTQNNRDFRLVYGYLDIDASGMIPKVTSMRLFSTDPETGLYITHNIAVSGGAFRE